MPELAEVETVRRVLLNQITNKPIKNVQVLYPKMLEVNEDFFKKCIINNSIIDIKRRGKFLVFELNDYYLVSHLRMEGKYFIKDLDEPINKHEHIIFEFADFSMRYHDTRKFGRMTLILKQDYDKYFAHLGPDANKIIDPKYLYDHLSQKKIPIKTVLLDQSIIAGLGNIYVDEVLYASKISPLRLAANINLKECQLIITHAKNILDEAIKHKGTTIRSYTSSLGVTGDYQNYLLVHTKVNQNCSCGGKIIKIKVGGRGTYYCPNCQK